MAIISTNFTLVRIAAMVHIMGVSGFLMLGLGMYTDLDPAWMVGIGLLISSFLGAFNVFEPKALGRELEAAKKYYDEANKIMKGK